MKKTARYLLLVLVGVSSCTTIKSIITPSPYERYAKSLESTGISQTNMGKTWLETGQRALQNPAAAATFPFKAELFFQESKPAAVGYRIEYDKTSSLTFRITATDKLKSGVFVNLVKSGGVSTNVFDQIVHDTTFVYNERNDQSLTLRIQPQLLVNQYVTVEIIENPKLGFPVQHGTRKNIQSFWGASRGGGSRKHEGVDIFSKRGTPILAVENGTVSRVQLNDLGGKVVWQRLGLAGQSIYYAHLDSQLVSPGQSVKRGEVIGLMGNTGNARTTPPHLHFGIYTSGGAIDPLKYIVERDTIPGKLVLDQKKLGEEIMVKNGDRIVPVDIVAVSTNEVSYTDFERTLFADKKLAVHTSRIRLKPNKENKFLLEGPASAATPVARFDASGTYEVLGQTETHLYLQQGDLRGWVAK